MTQQIHKGWPKGTLRSEKNRENCRKGWDKRRKLAQMRQAIVLERSTADDLLALADLTELEPQA